jgi:hypothetical protein
MWCWGVGTFGIQLGVGTWVMGAEERNGMLIWESVEKMAASGRRKQSQVSWAWQQAPFLTGKVLFPGMDSPGSHNWIGIVGSRASTRRWLQQHGCGTRRHCAPLDTLGRLPRERLWTIPIPQTWQLPNKSVDFSSRICAILFYVPEQFDDNFKSKSHETTYFWQ